MIIYEASFSAFNDIDLAVVLFKGWPSPKELRDVFYNVVSNYSYPYREDLCSEIARIKRNPFPRKIKGKELSFPTMFLRKDVYICFRRRNLHDTKANEMGEKCLISKK